MKKPVGVFVEDRYMHRICGLRESSNWICNLPDGHDADHAMIINCIYLSTDKGAFAAVSEGREDRTWYHQDISEDDLSYTYSNLPWSPPLICYEIV